MRLFIVCLLLFLCFSCQPSKQTSSTLPQDIVYIHSKDLKELSFIDPLQLIDSCSYIPLDNSILIGQVKNLQITDQYIFLVNNTNDSLYVFNLKGKFLNTIGTLGRGPQEYITLKSYCVSPDNDTVIIYDHYKLSFYTRDNHFIRSIDLAKHIPVKQYVSPVNSIYYAAPGKILFKHNMISGSKTFYSIYDYNLNQLEDIAQFPYVLSFSDPNSFIDLDFFRVTTWQNTLSCPIFYNDTIFTYSDAKLTPRFIIPAMKDKMISDRLIHQQDRKTQQEAMKVLFESGLYILHIYESEHYFFIIYNGKKACELIWNKEQHKGLLIQSCKTFWNVTYAPLAVPAYAILNDRPFFDSQGNRFFPIPESTQKIKAQITEDDNPVIVFYHLKPEGF